MNRFCRQEIVKGFGEEKQELLSAATVLVAGAGGLGCPVIAYLAACGIGKLIIADGDLISESNLNRQVLFGMKDIGLNKAQTAADRIAEKYQDVKMDVCPEFLSVHNILTILSGCDLVVDCTDNFTSRYLLSDACVLLDKPLVHGSIYQNQGQVAVLNVRDEQDQKLDYRDLFPDPSQLGNISDCNEAGVLGVLPGIIGTMMAAEVIKLVTGFGRPLLNRLLCYDLLTNFSYEVRLSENPEAKCKRPSSPAQLMAADYTVTCGPAQKISWENALQQRQDDPENVIIIDIRALQEEPRLIGIPHHCIPLEEIKNRRLTGDPGALLIFCQSGRRSDIAVRELSTLFPNKRILSIEGGIRSLHIIQTV